MIRRLQVAGWRAFEQLRLDFEPGLTFVVAENGIGKTSLIQAVSWGLYGSLSGIDADAARRFGEGQARVQLDVELPDGRTLVIDRTSSGRAETLHAAVDRIEVDEAAVGGIMTAAFGASCEFLSRTTVLPSTAVTDHSGGIFQLHQHLCHVFGVDDLQAAAASLRRVQVAAETAAKTHRQETRRAAADLTQLRDRLAAAQQAVLAAEGGVASARNAVTTAQALFDQARTIAAARQQAKAAQRLFQELRVTAEPMLAAVEEATKGPAQADSPRDQDELPETADDLAYFRHRLVRAETASTGVADRYRAELALTSARLATASDALAQLHGADAECPVCRRILEPNDVAAADDAHQQSIVHFTESQGRLQVLLAAAEERTKELRAMISRAAQLPSTSVPHADDDAGDIDEAASELERARAVEGHRAEEAAEARAERNALQRSISAAETSADKQRQSYIAHRREAAASIAAQAMAATADLILDERINPLATEITHRWKKVFVDRGELRLRHDGRLVLHHGSQEISFDQLSSGEKVIALLATRLLVLSASTRASFLWLDEPLEHLDPSNRRLAASLMSTTGQHVRQLLITTYEEKLARRLAKTDGVSIRYIRTAG